MKDDLPIENLGEKKPNEKRSIRNIPIPERHSYSSGDLPTNLSTNLPAELPNKQEKKRAKKTEQTEQAETVVPTHRVSVDGIKPGSIHVHTPVHTSASTSSHAPAHTSAQASVQTSNNRSSTHRSHESEPAFFTASEHDFETKDEDTIQHSDDYKHDKKRSKKGTFFLILGVIAVLFLIIQYFTQATITIKPAKYNMDQVAVDLPLSKINHKTIEIEEQISLNIEAKGTLKIEKKATGTVIIYNTFSSASQKLIATTRLETPNGLIYMLKKAVTVPGTKTVSGKVVAGSVEAELEAEQPGEKYNSGLKDFKIAGFKGTAKYDKFYGRSKTNMTGGQISIVPNISSDALSSALNDAKTKSLAKAELKYDEKIKNIEETYIYVQGAKTVEYPKSSQVTSKDGKTATITQKTNITGVIFEKGSLIRYLIEQEGLNGTGDAASTTVSSTSDATSTNIDVIDQSRIEYTGDISNLKISTGTAGVNSLKDKTAVLTVSGGATFSSAIVPDRVAKAVSGLSREQAISALKRIVDLESVEVSIWPWWKTKMPSSSSKINIKLLE